MKILFVKLVMEPINVLVVLIQKKSEGKNVTSAMIQLSTSLKEIVLIVVKVRAVLMVNVMEQIYALVLRLIAAEDLMDNSMTLRNSHVRNALLLVALNVIIIKKLIVQYV